MRTPQISWSRQDSPSSPPPQGAEGSQPRPSGTTDSGGGGGVPAGASAESQPGRSDSTPPQPNDAERLRKQVQDTEAWVQRLKDAKAEGTRLSQEVRPAPTPTPQTPPRPKDEIDAILSPLNAGDDRGFVQNLLDKATQNALNRIRTSENEQVLVKKITDIVGEHAPDVPMPLFWAFVDDAIVLEPTNVSKQVEAAIGLSRRALKERDDRLNSRRDENTQNRQSVETIGGGASRGPRPGQTSDDNATMVDDIKRIQAARR